MAGSKKPKILKLSKAATDEQNVLSAELECILTEDSLALIDQCVETALSSREAPIMAAILERIRSLDLSSAAGHSTESNGQGWVGIESLSALRGLVGGRFHNLKERWIEAGFPLKEHRGDKGQSCEVNSQGWIELSNWIMKQGFEARLTPEDSSSLFELRALESSKS